MIMTIGAPKTAVTVLMLISVGANAVRAKRSQNRQKALPPRKHAGIIKSGFVVPKSRLTKCGTAMPTKETGPANAVMHAASTLDKSTKSIRSSFKFTPIFCAYVSPS